MSKYRFNKITLLIMSVFISSLFLTSANFSYAGIDELKQNVNKLEISTDNAASSSDNQSQAAPAEGAAANNQAAGAAGMKVTSESVSSGLESIKSGFKGIFEGLKDIFKGLFDIFKELVNNFKNLFSSVEGDVKQLGEEVSKGAQEIGNEIKSGAAGVGEAANNAADAANEAVNNAVNGDRANQAAGVEIPNAASEVQASQSGTVIDEDPDGLNVRTGPWGEVIGTLQKGAKIEIIGQEGDWYKIKLDGKEAYVYAGLVSKDTVKQPKDAQQTEGANADGSNANANAANNGSSNSNSTASSNTGAKKTEPAAEQKEQQEAKSADTPYFNQYDNEFFSASTCQNTSLAMTLAKYGWKGNPDQITKGYGKDMAQTPAGLENVFNSIAEQDGLNVRIKSHTDGTMELINKLLAEGKPVIAHGWFTKSGHVVTITGFDGQNYTVNDPAGQWNQEFKGGYSGGSGKSVKYSKESMTEALVENGEVWCHEIYNVNDKVAGL